MARVYLNAASFQAAKSPQKMTALFLDQQVELPYFKAFDETFTSLDGIYQQLDTHIEQLLVQQGWQPEILRHTPILLGSTGYVVSHFEHCLATQQPLHIDYNLAVIGRYLQRHYSAPVFHFATSCTSSAQAIHSAYKMIQNGYAAQALVIGFEHFNRFTFEHFYAMNLLAKNLPYQPFVQSTGMILGEGMACLALSNQPTPNASCEMIGATSLTDYHHLSNSSPSQLSQLIQQIMESANVSAEQIQAVKTHSIGGAFDAAEQQVLNELLPHSTWLLAKPFLGHTLGASGALETAWLLENLRAGTFADLPQPTDATYLPFAHGNAVNNGYYLNYFLGFGGSHAGWLLHWQS